MKTFKPTLEVLEGRTLPSGLFVPPNHDLPLPNPGGAQQMIVLPPSKPTSVSDVVHNPFSGISLTPGGTSETIAQTSSTAKVPAMWGANWQPGMNIFYNVRAPQEQSAISIEFTGAGVVDPRNPDVVYAKSLIDNNFGDVLSVSVPDGGTVLLGGAHGKGLFGDASVRGVTLVEVLAAAKPSTGITMR